MVSRFSRKQNWSLIFEKQNYLRYVSVLVDLSRMEGLRQGHVVASQLMDVAIRVPAIRPFAVEQMALLLESSSGFAVRGITGQVAFSSMCEVLYAAAWICGEFAS